MIELPCLNLPSIYHIGSLQRENRGSRHATSQEGDCLSASLCPETWNYILKLGGLPWWEMTRADALFVDALAVTEDTWQHVRRWAEQQGLIEYVELYEVTVKNPDTDEPMTFLCWTKEAAEAEMEEGGSIKHVPRQPILSSAGAQRAMQGDARLQKADGFILQFFVQDVARQHIPEIVGVYYDDELKEFMHIAPRMAIFPDQVGSFECKIVSPSFVLDDDELLLGIPERVWHSVPIDEGARRPRMAA
ncbi:Uncharacterised protein [Achromobacter sp. 2789STDY5608633]|uniref:hypothetical protein n=1 Tax=Achromobacter sp. 2789STDY5608633 TaxID=1806501 RepID=UPI0006C3B15D|nr:hypothetical protein [Achromobacter sp. 2789STDY5608633]CUJ49210.1 Uncharacterised protein [Achromobacter sp. 2789STDY5608633]